MTEVVDSPEAGETMLAEELAEELTEELTEASLAAKNPSTADLMKAISALQKTVESKFTTISATMSSLQTTLSTMSGKVRDIEVAVTTHADRLESLEALCKTLQDGYNYQRKKVLDLESRSRRQNIRITGIPEGAEKGNPSEFVSALIPTLFGSDQFPDKVLVDIAHRIGPRPAQAGSPCSLIAKLHYMHTRVRVTKLATQKSPLHCEGVRVSIFPDLPTEVFLERKKYGGVRQRCRTAGFQSGFLHPCRFRTTADDGVTRFFPSPGEASQFLDQKLGNGTSS